jgi:hypothetical protein
MHPPSATPATSSPRQPLPRQDWDPNRRWYDEYIHMLHVANEAIIKHVRLAQEGYALTRDLQAARFEVAQAYDLGSADLARIGRELRTKLDAITNELRRRHWPDGEGEDDDED